MFRLKNAIHSFALLGLLLFITFSCDDSPEQKEGKLTLSFISAPSSSARKAGNEAKKLLVSISDATGKVIETKKELSLYNFQGEFLSEPLSLTTGSYRLTEFIVLNADDEVVYVTPLEGSALAYLVNDPLPITFDIVENEVTKVAPEVIEASGHTADEFGYATFSFDVVETISFLLGVFVYDDASHSLKLTSGTLQIKSGTTVLFTGEMGSVTNRVTINNIGATYTLAISKSGYTTYKKDFTGNELKSFVNFPLNISLTEAETNRAILFDGIDDYIDLGNIYDDATLPVTIAAWIYIDNTVAGYNPIFVSQDNLPLYNGFLFSSTLSGVFVEYGDGMGQNNSIYRRGASYISGTNIGGKWIHVAGVIRGATDMDLYIDGVKISPVYSGSSNFPMSSNHPDDVAKIGKWISNGITSHFKGMIDDIRIWKRSLTSTEISDAMAKKDPRGDSSLIGFWDFNEPSGNIVFDKSVNSFNGQLIGGSSRQVVAVPN
jgi:hypothetical protein